MTDLPESKADQAADLPTTDQSATDVAPVETSSVNESGTATEIVTVPVMPVVDAVPVAAAVDDVEAADVAGSTDVVAPEARPRRRRSLALRFGGSFILGFALVVGVGAGVMYAWSQQYAGRILPGVRVGDTEIGGLTRDEASAAIANAYAGLGNGRLVLTGPDGTATSVSYADVGRGPDTAALLDAAFAVGRNGELLADLVGAPQTALHGATLDAAVTYDQTRLTNVVKELAGTIDQAPADAYVSAGQGGMFAVTPSRDGRAVDQDALLTTLDAQLAAVDTPGSITATVPMVTVPPDVSTASADAAKSAADRMAADVIVTRGDESWTVKRASLAPLLSFSRTDEGTIVPVLADAGLDPIVDTLAGDVNQKVRNAGLKRVGGHIVATTPSREGRTLDPLGMKAVIINEMRARGRGDAASPVAAVVDAVDPKLTTEDAASFAPRMKVISSYSVFYWVIVNNHWGGNIEAPATKIDGMVVPAGGTFDFWKAVGDLRKLPGTGPGNAIEGGKITVTGAFGGGICTTSTTLFNAAFHAGMIPLARKNHNEYITRYPAGLDATVWIVGKTKQTMSFKNDTKYPIMIQRVITQSGNKRWLTFKIWSVPNGRSAKVTNTVIKHGPRAKDTIVRDSSKPVGYRYRNNDPADGAKVWTTVSIYEHGKLHWTKRYYSNYPAVDGVLVVGTKEAK